MSAASIEQTFKTITQYARMLTRGFLACLYDKCEVMNIPKTNERTPRYSTIGIQLFEWLALALSAIINNTIKWLSLKVFASLKPCIDGFKSEVCLWNSRSVARQIGEWYVWCMRQWYREKRSRHLQYCLCHWQVLIQSNLYFVRPKPNIL